MTGTEVSDMPLFLRELAAAVLLAAAFLLVLDACAERMGWCKENGNHFASAAFDVETAQGSEFQERGDWLIHCPACSTSTEPSA